MSFFAGPMTSTPGRWADQHYGLKQTPIRDRAAVFQQDATADGPASWRNDLKKSAGTEAGALTYGMKQEHLASEASKSHRMPSRGLGVQNGAKPTIVI